MIAFLGASYFRFLGRGQRYGLSARGSGDRRRSRVSTRSFRSFANSGSRRRTPWPSTSSSTRCSTANSATGAFRFDLTPGQETVIDANVTLFARKATPALGLAPLSSMYFVGKADRRFHDDFRGELHDSDGLLMHTGAGEWIWRPLSNPAAPSVSAFLDTNPRGFGLLQRDRNFSDYEDLELAYELRPSYWIEPHEGWGEGRVELVELPTSDETNDNIVAAWAPKDGLDAGKSLAYGYRITSLATDQSLTPGGRTVGTFRVAPRALGAPESPPPGATRFLIDFLRRRLVVLHERPLAGADGRHGLGGPDPAHVPHPQHAHPRLPRRRRRRGRPGPERRPPRLPARRRQGADRDLDLSLAGVKGKPVRIGHGKNSPKQTQARPSSSKQNDLDLLGSIWRNRDFSMGYTRSKQKNSWSPFLPAAGGALLTRRRLLIVQTYSTDF